MINMKEDIYLEIKDNLIKRYQVDKSKIKQEKIEELRKKVIANDARTFSQIAEIVHDLFNTEHLLGQKSLEDDFLFLLLNRK